jgi:hypothetical protein
VERQTSKKSDIYMVISGMNPNKYWEAVVNLPYIINAKIDLIGFNYTPHQFQKIVR